MTGRISFLDVFSGRYKEAFDFLHFWIRIHIDEDKNFNLKKGEWLKDEGAHIKVGIGENFFQCGECFGPNLDIPNDARLLAMTGLKLKFVLELNDQYQALEFASKKSDALEIQKAEQDIKIQIRDQNEMIKRCFATIHEWNPTLLRALLIPKPLLEKPILNQMWERGPSEASVTVRYVYKIFLFH